jgi:hypothetical protein
MRRCKNWYRRRWTREKTPDGGDKRVQSGGGAAEAAKGDGHLQGDGDEENLGFGFRQQEQTGGRKAAVHEEEGWGVSGYQKADKELLAARGLKDRETSDEELREARKQARTEAKK